MHSKARTKFPFSKKCLQSETYAAAFSIISSPFSFCGEIFSSTGSMRPSHFVMSSGFTIFSMETLSCCIFSLIIFSESQDKMRIAVRKYMQFWVALLVVAECLSQLPHCSISTIQSVNHSKHNCSIFSQSMGLVATKAVKLLQMLFIHRFYQN